FPRERDHVCTMGEHLFHPFKGMHGIVCDDEDGAVVPHLPDLLISKVHQVDMKDIGAGFPEKLCQSCIVGMYPCPDLHRDDDPFGLERLYAPDKFIRMMEVIFTDPGLFHRLLAAVGIDLIDHLVSELPGGLPERVRAAPPHIDSGHNITPAELPDLLSDHLER